tara:strand:+ start:99 stop:812 length:714 start_codon:yes stop_codon:yes gene_type:complete
MNTFIFALADKTIKTFLSDKGDSTEDVQLVLKEGGVDQTYTDMLSFAGGTPEGAYLQSLYVDEDGKLKVNEEHLMSTKFVTEDCPVIESLLKANGSNQKENSDDRFASAILTKNEDYLNGLTPMNVYGKGRKNNVFFNLAGIKVTKPGKGYSHPPKLTISDPNPHPQKEIETLIGVGFRAPKFSISFVGGELKGVNLEEWGQGYCSFDYSFSLPDDPKGEVPEIEPFIVNEIYGKDV